MLIETLPDDLRPHEPTFHAIIRDGLALFNQRYGALRGVMSLTGEARNIHDCLTETAKKYFPDNYRQEGNLFLLVIGKYRIRIKKFDAYLRSSSYPTDAVFDFMCQDAEPTSGDLFGDIKPLNLVLGYVLNGVDILKSDPWLTKPQGVDVAPQWQYLLRSDASSVPMPTLPATSPVAPGDEKSRVKPKTEKKPSVIGEFRNRES